MILDALKATRAVLGMRPTSQRMVGYSRQTIGRLRVSRKVSLDRWKTKRPLTQTLGRRRVVTTRCFPALTSPAAYAKE